VVYGPVAKQWLWKQQPLLGNAHNRIMGLCNPFLSNSSVNTFPWKWTHATIEEWCFLLGPRRGRISVFQLSEVKYLGDESVVSWQSACEEKTRTLVWYGRQPGTQLKVGSSVGFCMGGCEEKFVARVQLECVIQWDCYSSCIKSFARKWLVGTVIDWGP
jgi:hypothetical protein